MTNQDRKYGNGRKTGKAEMSDRVDYVLNLLLKGLHAREILEYSRDEAVWEKLKKPMWNVDIKAIENYITKANKRLDKIAAPIREREITKARLRLETFMRKADSIQDYKTAASIQGDISKLLGLNKPQGIDVTGGITTTVKYDYSKLTKKELEVVEDILKKAIKRGEK